MFLTSCEAHTRFSAIEIFSIALAALCHDVDHPGLTNAFLLTTYDPLALRYNDISILENHHASTTFFTIMVPILSLSNFISNNMEYESKKSK